MAFGQTIISNKNMLFTVVPQNPKPIPKTLPFFPCSTPQNSLLLRKRPRSTVPTLKFSSDYRDQNYNLQTSSPKPSEIPWSKDLYVVAQLNQWNPKYPDFKHKDTGEALWIEGRNNPHWVKSQLEILDSRMGSLQDQDDKMFSSMAGDDLLPF